MKEKCGKCKRKYSEEVSKWKPMKGEWISESMDMTLLHYKGLCQECMDKLFPLVKERIT